MVAASYIRMASTRSQARALRKYTNIDMVCSSELSEMVDEAPTPMITVDQLTTVKQLLGDKQVSKEKFTEMLFNLFQHTNYTNLTQTQGNELIKVLQNYIAQ